jgi:uracil-DNA glycosylase family 4
VGAAGALLDELLGVIGWSRREVYITNVVKCRPPGNRDPEPDEIAACAPWLRRQLEVLDPALVVTLGRFSMQTFLPGSRIGQAHGTMRPVDPATGAHEAMAYALYHPAAAFRQGGLTETMKLDMLGIPDALTRARERRAERPASEMTSDAMSADAAPSTVGSPGARGAEAARTGSVPPPSSPLEPAPIGPPPLPAAAGDGTGEPSEEELGSLLATGMGTPDDTLEDRDQMGMFS